MGMVGRGEGWRLGKGQPKFKDLLESCIYKLTKSYDKEKLELGQRWSA